MTLFIYRTEALYMKAKSWPWVCFTNRLWAVKLLL